MNLKCPLVGVLVMLDVKCRFITKPATVSLVVLLTLDLSPITQQWQSHRLHSNPSSLPAEEHTGFTVQTGW